jgi:hypothetical protein
LVKTKQLFVRIDKEKADLYIAALKDSGITMKEDFERHISEVVRTKGLRSRELIANELKLKADAMLAQVKIDRMNLQEAFTDGIIVDVEKALARTDRNGMVKTHTYESLEFFIKDISERHHVPSSSVLVCMRQRVHTFYMDDRSELQRI